MRQAEAQRGEQGVQHFLVLQESFRCSAQNEYFVRYMSHLRRSCSMKTHLN